VQELRERGTMSEYGTVQVMNGTVMRVYSAHFGGHFVARCPQCDTSCAYWDEEDLDENGNLLCYCEVTE
jgi:hypothetical protein